MKRFIFSVTAYLLYALFFVLYGIKQVSGFFIGLNSVIASIYANLERFFCYVWKLTLGHIIVIDSTGADHPIRFGLIIVFCAVTFIVIVVDLTATLLVRHAKRSAKELKNSLADEKNKLDAGEKINNLDTGYDANNVQFANNKEPYVSLEKSYVQAVSNEDIIDPSKPKYQPAVRIFLTVIYGVSVLIFLFFRFLWDNRYEPVYSFFSSIYSSWFGFQMDQLDKFFKTLFRTFYYNPIANVGGITWYSGQLAELLILFIVFVIFWIIVLVICHFVMKEYRSRKNISHSIAISGDDKEFSDKSLSILGNADLKNVKTEVTSIADLSTSKPTQERNKQLHNQAAYIDDIGEKVSDAGKAPSPLQQIQASPTRQPLTPEEMPEDLSMNKGVQLNDIASIEDAFKEETNTVSIHPFVVSEESIPSVDLSSIDITHVADIESIIPLSGAMQKKAVDDWISFDEDGYAYLVKQGKPFVDDEEDISDVVTTDNLDKTAIVNRFGGNYYDVLNSLEPFVLKPLNYDEEIENIKNRKKDASVLSADQLLKDSLASEPFKEDKNNTAIIAEQTAHRPSASNNDTDQAIVPTSSAQAASAACGADLTIESEENKSKAKIVEGQNRYKSFVPHIDMPKIHKEENKNNRPNKPVCIASALTSPPLSTAEQALVSPKISNYSSSLNKSSHPIGPMRNLQPEKNLKPVVPNIIGIDVFAHYKQADDSKDDAVRILTPSEAFQEAALMSFNVPKPIVVNKDLMENKKEVNEESQKIAIASIRTIEFDSKKVNNKKIIPPKTPVEPRKVSIDSFMKGGNSK